MMMVSGSSNSSQSSNNSQSSSGSQSVSIPFKYRKNGKSEEDFFNYWNSSEGTKKRRECTCKLSNEINYERCRLCHSQVNHHGLCACGIKICKKCTRYWHHATTVKIVRKLTLSLFVATQDTQEAEKSRGRQLYL